MLHHRLIYGGLLLLLGCGVENAFWTKDDPPEPQTGAPTAEPAFDTVEEPAEDSDSDEEPAEEPSSSPTSEPSAQPSSDPSSEPSSDPSSEPSSEPSDEPGDSQDNPRYPNYGELVINEVMVNPVSVADAEGEWLELLNVTSDWLKLNYHYLADDGVDEYMIEPVSTDSLIVGPGDYLLICAIDNYWSNGGVDCHGVFLYQTFGGGFGLSNTSDEVLILKPNGALIDRMSYSNSLVIEGSSLGLDSNYATASSNDYASSWCEQRSFMPMGDFGTPGEFNDICF